jgi:hypothetical protein
MRETINITTPLQSARDILEEQCGAKLPGDSCSKSYDELVNRPQEAFRMMNDPSSMVRNRATKAIQVYEIATGEKVKPRSHQETAPEEAPSVVSPFQRKLKTRRSG